MGQKKKRRRMKDELVVRLLAHFHFPGGGSGREKKKITLPFKNPKNKNQRNKTMRWKKREKEG